MAARGATKTPCAHGDHRSDSPRLPESSKDTCGKASPVPSIKFGSLIFFQSGRPGRSPSINSGNAPLAFTRFLFSAKDKSQEQETLRRWIYVGKRANSLKLRSGI